MKIIRYNKQFLDDKDKKAVIKALNQKLITGGDSVTIFENKLKNFLKVKYALTCSNGTAGLHLAFEAINIKKNDVIIMPLVNFIASFSMANLYGAKVFFADVDSITGQMTPETLLKCIKDNKLKRIKAIVVMYMGGHPDNVINFYKLKKKYKFKIIEDACHAFGASYKSKDRYYKIGSCRHSDICVFSFHPVKTITTGEGGLVCTNNKEFSFKIKYFRNHNIERNKNYWNYNISKPAFNYRLSDINCALGISQLSKVNFIISSRKKIFENYNKFLKKHSSKLTLRPLKNGERPCFHLGILNIKFKKKKNKNGLFRYLNKRNIFPQYHYKPINLFKFTKNLKINFKNFPGTKKYYSSSISLPLYVNLKQSEVQRITKTIVKYLN